MMKLGYACIVLAISTDNKAGIWYLSNGLKAYYLPLSLFNGFKSGISKANLSLILLR